MKPLAAVLLAACALSTRAPAADPWPGEPAAEAVNLTAVDPGLNTNNWSGAFWNPETRTLWLACNFGYFWALVEDGAGSFQVATNAAGVPAKWTPGGDLEGICQAEYGKPLVFLMDENGWIREYDVSEFGAANETRTWDIRAECPEVDGLGPEGIAFLPDAWLAREGFTDTNGVPAASSNGMGGLMAVGHQSNGFVHVFDLGSAGGAYTYVGRYKTSRAETGVLGGQCRQTRSVTAESGRRAQAACEGKGGGEGREREGVGEGRYEGAFRRY